MITLSDKEMQGLQNLTIEKQKNKLKRIFLSELDTSQFSLEQAADFFDQGFDDAISLPSMNDREILKLCRIAYFKNEQVAMTEEFKHCESKQKWPGRSLYLSAMLEKLLAH